MVQKVQALNKRIEAINTKRTRAEAQVEMLKKQLSQDIKAYKEAHGIDLMDANFGKLCAKVKVELEKVEGEIKAEYELKEKVVRAIENSEYDEAYRLLGIERVSEEVVEEVTGKEEDDAGWGDVDVVGLDDEDGVKIEEEVEVEEDVSIEEGTFLDVEEEKPKKKEVKGTSALDAVSSIEIEVEDDDEEIQVPTLEDEDWGFGDMLSGTKFEKK